MEFLPQISLIAAIGVGLSFKLESLAEANRTANRAQPHSASNGERRQSSHVIQKIISAAVLAGSVYIALSPDFTALDAHWAYASMGLIAGCWFMRKTHISIP